MKDRLRISARSISRALQAHASQERKKINEWFFKTEEGQYGAHDRFLGIKNSDVRLVAKEYDAIDLREVQKLLRSSYNEQRLCALIILVKKFKKASKKDLKKIYDLYMENIDYVNNWNLVDLSAPHILGEYIYNQKESKILDQLCQSHSQWHRRICMIATWSFTKRNEYDSTLYFAEKLLTDQEDLMHKVVGWMLREVWKRDPVVCEKFIRTYYDAMSRTTLRYAIEKMPEKKRLLYLKKTFGH